MNKEITYDLVVLLVYVCGCTFGLFSSLVYHTFCCMDTRSCILLRKLDFIGISVTMLVSNIVMVHYSFYCSPAHQSLYYAATCLLAPFLLALPFLQKVHDQDWLRVGIYCSTVLLPLTQFLHVLCTTGLSGEPGLQQIYSALFNSYSSYALGVLIYVSKIPERWWPGQFDIWGHSHQYWHFLVCLGQLSLFNGAFNLFSSQIEHAFPNCAVV